MNVNEPVTTTTLPVLTSAPSGLRAILELPDSELVQWLEGIGQPAFRAKQIRRWLIQRRISSFEQMSDLPAALRQQLAASFRFSSFEAAGHQIAKDRTEKLLL